VLLIAWFTPLRYPIPNPMAQPAAAQPNLDAENDRRDREGDAEHP
jgi:hypothetical protein